MNNQPNDIFSRAMIEIHNDISRTRTSLSIDIDKDDPDPTLTVATAITDVLKNPHIVRKDQLNCGSGGIMSNLSSPLQLPHDFIYDDKRSCRSVFEMLNSHLELNRTKDGWGRDIYAHPHIQSQFIGWCMAVHVNNTMSGFVQMHEYAEKMAEIRNGLPKRGETKALYHIDDSPYQSATNSVDVQEAAEMSAEQLFNAGKRIDGVADKEKSVNVASIIGKIPVPENIGEAVKEAEATWGEGTWAALRNAAKIVIEQMSLKSYSVFQHEDGIYEDPRGGYIDRMDLVRWLEDRMAAHLLNSAPVTPPSLNGFRAGQFVRHYAGNEYFIIAGPDDVLIEDTAQHAYVYLGKDGFVWVRSKASFEGGVTLEDTQVSADDIRSGKRVARFAVTPVTEVSPEVVEVAKKYCADQVAQGFFAGFTLNFFSKG